MEKMRNKFKEYLDAIGESPHSFHRRSRTSLATIYNAYNGKRIYRRTAVQICRHCKGLVTLEDFGYDKNKLKSKQRGQNAPEERKE